MIVVINNGSKFSKVTSTVLLCSVLPKNTFVFLLLINISHQKERKKTRHMQGRHFSWQANVTHKVCWAAVCSAVCKDNTNPSLTSVHTWLFHFLVLVLSIVWYMVRQQWAYYRIGSHLWKAEGGGCCTVALLVCFIVCWWCSRTKLKPLACCRSTAFVVENLVWMSEDIPQQFLSEFPFWSSYTSSLSAWIC